MSIEKQPPKIHKFGDQSIFDVIFIVEGNEFHCHKMDDKELFEIEANPVAFRRLMEILYNGVFEDYKTMFRDNYRYTKALPVFWREAADLLELAERCSLLEVVRRCFEVYMISTGLNCSHADCYHCATKLLLAVRYELNDYKATGRVNHKTTTSALSIVSSVHKYIHFPASALLFLMKKPQ